MRLDSENFARYRKWIPSFLQAGLIRIFYRFRAVVYRGYQVHCNCCNSQFRIYLPPHRECPGCGAQARHRLMLFYLKEKTDLFLQPYRLLHFAPEVSLERILRSSSNIEYMSADLDSRRAMEKVDINDIQYADESFDAILCSHVLEHIPRDLDAMRELYRVLVKGGWAILQVPIDMNREETYEDFSITSPAGRAKHFGRYDHCRIYGRDYKKRLEQAGFEVKIDPYVRTFSPDEIEKYGLEDWEDVYFCTKLRR
ncbi:MAG: methyltransferase domain-containing protein [Halioglobus sp.]